MVFRRGAAILVLALLSASCAPQERPDQVLRYRQKEMYKSLDPVVAGDDNSLVYIYLLFDGLVEFVPDTLAVRPALASSWTISTDGLVYTFTLRDGIRFHDGRPITTDDVVWSIQRAVSHPTTQKKSFFSALAGVTAPDGGTVVMTLSRPYDAFLSVLASEAGSVVPREVYARPGEEYLSKPVGSGPFMLESIEPGVSITLARFPGHWKKPPADPIQKIRVRLIENSTTALQEYLTGNLDFTQELPPGQRRVLMKEHPGDFHHWTGQQLFYVAFNHASPLIKDNLLLRQAILHAIDHDFIVRVLQEEKDQVATGLIPPGMLGHLAGQEAPVHDPNMAASLLAKAGYPDGRGLPELTYMTNSTEGFILIAERLRSDLAAIGIKLKIRTMDFPTYMDATSPSRVTGPDAEIFKQSFYCDYPDPDNFITEQFGRSGYANSGRYDNPEFERLLVEARLETDRARRKEMYENLDRFVMSDAALVPLYWYGKDILLKPEFTGFVPSPMGTFGIPWEEMSLKR